MMATKPTKALQKRLLFNSSMVGLLY
jgi:hypothetical protein